jgi:hypothetical protein
LKVPPHETEVTKGALPVAGSVGNCTGTGRASEAPGAVGGFVVLVWGAMGGFMWVGVR